VVLYSHRTMVPGTLYTFTFQLRNLISSSGEPFRPCIRASRISENPCVHPKP
jgi:hypothetical protein